MSNDFRSASRITWILSEIWAACSWQNRESRERGEWADISTREIEGKLFDRKSVSYVHGSVYKPTFTPGSSLLSRISDFIPWNRVCVLFQLTVVFSNFRRLMCAQYLPYANVCIVDTYHQLSPSHPLTMRYRLYRHYHVPSLCFPLHFPFPFPFCLALCQSSVQQHICTYVVYSRLQPDIFGAAPPVSKVHDFWGDRLTALRDNRRCLLTSLRFSNLYASIEFLFRVLWFRMSLFRCFSRKSRLLFVLLLHVYITHGYLAIDANKFSGNVGHRQPWWQGLISPSVEVELYFSEQEHLTIQRIEYVTCFESNDGR